jgi:hypothetical protein
LTVVEEVVVGANIAVGHGQVGAHHNPRGQETVDSLGFRLADMVLCSVHPLHQPPGATQEAS